MCCFIEAVPCSQGNHITCVSTRGIFTTGQASPSYIDGSVIGSLDAIVRIGFALVCLNPQLLQSKDDLITKDESVVKPTNMLVMQLETSVHATRIRFSSCMFTAEGPKGDRSSCIGFGYE